MITIPLSDLKVFMGRCSDIKENRLLPIYSYIKLDVTKDSVTLSKCNGNSFIIQTIPATTKKPNVFLLPEQQLSAIVNTCQQEEIEIEVEDCMVGKENKPNITITHGRKTKLQTECVVNFQKFHDIEKAKPVQISDEVIKSLFIAKSIINTNVEYKLWMSYVHVKQVGKKVCVFGSDGTVMYFRLFKDKIPSMILEVDTCSVLSKYQNLEYYTAGNYHIFDTGSCTYGFIGVEQIAPEFELVAKQCDKKNHFIIDRKELVSFCEYILRANPSSLVPMISIEDNGENSIKMKFIADVQNLDSEEEFKVVKNFKAETFDFNPKLLLPLIRNIPYDKLQFNGIISFNYFITTDEDPDYIGVLRQMQKVSPGDPAATKAEPKKDK